MNETTKETVADVLADIHDRIDRLPGHHRKDLRELADRIERAHAAWAGRVPEGLKAAVLAELRTCLGTDGTAYRRVRELLSAAPDPKPAPEAEAREDRRYCVSLPFDLIAELRRLDRIASAIGASKDIGDSYDEAARGLVCRLRSGAASHPSPEPRDG